MDEDTRLLETLRFFADYFCVTEDKALITLADRISAEVYSTVDSSPALLPPEVLLVAARLPEFEETHGYWIALHPNCPSEWVLAMIDAVQDGLSEQEGRNPRSLMARLGAVCGNSALCDQSLVMRVVDRIDRNLHSCDPADREWSWQILQSALVNHRSPAAVNEVALRWIAVEERTGADTRAVNGHIEIASVRMAQRSDLTAAQFIEVVPRVCDTDNAELLASRAQILLSSPHAHLLTEEQRSALILAVASV